MIFEDALNEREHAVAKMVIAEEESLRRHVVIALSGAHAYGFPSPDSDLDLKGIHVLPTSSLVGLRLPNLHADRMEIIDGTEIDYSSNEIGAALAGIVKGNGNFLERVLGTCIAYTAPEHATLISLAAAEVEGLGGTLNRAFAALEDAVARSVLPDEPRGVDDLEAWLVELRRARFSH